MPGVAAVKLLGLVTIDLIALMGLLDFGTTDMCLVYYTGDGAPPRAAAAAVLLPRRGRRPGGRRPGADLGWLKP
jgi:hypothetical protein